MSDTVKEARVKREGEGPSIPGFQLIEKSGETSTAEIWTALQISLDRMVTIWALKPVVACDVSRADHFELVARMVSRIRHPGLVQIIDISRLENGVPYVVFENVDGLALATLLHNEKKLDQKRAATIVAEIAKVLDSAWKQCGFVHRNIKPGTILLGPGDSVKITNFNSATLVKPGENPLAYDEGMVVGTPNYASPEQIECLRSIDFHSDMYSTGALFYQMVTGVAPFDEEKDPMKVLELQRVGTIEDPRNADPSVLPGFAHIMQRMMAKSPEERYRWWQDVVEDLQRVLAGRPPFLSGSDYSPPVSTIGVSYAGAAASHFGSNVRKARVQMARSTSGNASGSRASSGKRYGAPSGPGCLTRVLAVGFIVLFTAFIVVLRVRDLERIDKLAMKPDAGVEPEISVAAGSPADMSGDPESENVPDGDVVSTDEGMSGVADSLDYPVSPTDNGAAAATDTALAEANPADGAAPVNPAELAEGTSPAENGTESAESALPPQEKLVSDICHAVKTMSFAEAKAYASKRFRESENVKDIDVDACKLIWSAFRDACSFEDLVGGSMTRSPVPCPISVAGSKMTVSTKMYANGEVIGKVQLPDGTSRLGQRIDVSQMTPAEMYDFVLSTVVEKTRPSLLSRAFLTMKAGDSGEFSILVQKYNIEELKPFLDFIGK